MFCDPGRAVNVISLTTVTVTEEGGARNYFPLSKTRKIYNVKLNQIACVFFLVFNTKTTNCRRIFGQPLETETLAILFQKA